MTTLEELVKKVLQAWDKFTDWISTGLEFLGSWLGTSFQWLSDEFSNFSEALQSGLTDVWNMANDAWNKAVQAVSDAANAFTNAIAEAWNYAQDALSAAQSYADGVVDAISAVTEDFVYAVVAGVETIANDAQALATDALNGVDYVAGVVDDIMINFDLWVQGSINWLLDFFIETEDESETYKSGVSG